MRFIKMHGIGNDYVYVNGFDERIDDPAALAPVISNRHTGVGGDGLILVLPPEPGTVAHVRMRMYNADGSEAEMCGNGIRCVAKLAHDHGITDANPMRVQTGCGVLSLDYTTNGTGKVDTVTVDMGAPVLDLPRIPVDESVLDGALDGAGFVSMGNPHVVLFASDLDSLDLERIGPPLEHHPAFPNRINVHWVDVRSPGEVSMRTWERGSGITLACGTGACAVCVAGVRAGRTRRRLLTHLPGGDLEVHWQESDDHVLMTGPATEVFAGEWSM